MINFRLLFFYILLISGLLFTISPVSADSPKRIISLAPNITEILFGIGLGDRIIGVTSFCDYPEQAKKKPKIGGMSNPSLETVISLKPDIVVMTTDGNPKEFEERLRSLGIKTYVFKARKLAELPQGIRDMGSALGAKDRAVELAKKIESAFQDASHFPIHSSPGKKVLFIIWPAPLIVAGPGSAIDDIITLLGRENIASKVNVSYPKYSVESIIQQAADIIFIGKGHSDIKKMSRGLLDKMVSVPAVRNGNVFYVSDSLYRLGPRVINGIEEMAACIR
jgi:iron complex transport system substrate-binding protein